MIYMEKYFIIVDKYEIFILNIKYVHYKVKKNYYKIEYVNDIKQKGEEFYEN